MNYLDIEYFVMKIFDHYPDIRIVLRKYFIDIIHNLLKEKIIKFIKIINKVYFRNIFYQISK